MLRQTQSLQMGSVLVFICLAVRRSASIYTCIVVMNSVNWNNYLCAFLMIFISPLEEQNVLCCDCGCFFYRVALTFFVMFFTPNMQQKEYCPSVYRRFLSFTLLGVAVTDLARWNFLCSYLVKLICKTFFSSNFWGFKN